MGLGKNILENWKRTEVYGRGAGEPYACERGSVKLFL